MLIDHGADIYPCWPASITAATACGYAHMDQFLIEKGADLDLDWSGQMILCYATRAGHESTVRLIVECGVDFDGTENGLIHCSTQLSKGMINCRRIR